MELNHQRKPLRGALPLLLAATCSTHDGLLTVDHRVKASFLLNLLRFIDWPHDICPPDGRLNVLVCGAYSLDGFFALQQELAGTRTIAVQRIKDVTPERVEKGHVLFVSADKPLVAVPIARGLLTVGESHGFTARGGIINLGLVGGRPRFDLNEEMAQACGFTIDPKLRKLRLPDWYASRFP